MKEPKVIQTLDIENNCTGIFSGDEFIFDNLTDFVNQADYAWRHSSLFDDQQICYLSLFLRGNDLIEWCDDPTSVRSMQEMIAAQKAAALTAKIDISGMCFFDVLPDHLMYKWFSSRHTAMAKIASTLERPQDYDILHKIHVLTQNVSKQDIIVHNKREKVEYDIFSSATGRLATKKGSFPILNISKEERVSITPQNDMFLELDLNGAEIRTLLALSDKQQPNHDIHEYNKEVLTGGSTRKETKARFFAWLYNPEAVDNELEKLYNKKAYMQFYKEGYITTPFGRKLEVDERRALNYLTQSTTSDIVLENAYKIMKFLKGKKSFVAFTMHDSVVLDFCKEEHGLVSEIKDIFETNMFGRFLSTVNIGKNYGNLKEVKVD